MTIGCTEKFCILGVACSQTVVVDNLILRFASCHDVIVVLLEGVESLLDRLAVSCPIAFVVSAHITYVIDFIIAEHHVAAGLADCSEVVNVGELRHFALLCAVVWTRAGRQLSSGSKGRSCEVLVCNSHCAVYVWQIQVAPVDGYHVSCLAQNLLIYASTLDVSASALIDDGCCGWLTVVVYRQFWCRSEVELHIMLLSIITTNLI